MPEHLYRCPYGIIESEDPTAPAQPCPDRRCCAWSDLRLWFGYKPDTLDPKTFAAYFADIAHEGSGLYEKCAVLGSKALAFMTQIHTTQSFTGVGIPPDLKKQVGGDEALRRVWTEKRIERITSPQSIFLFGKAYLSTPQSLPTKTAVVKFVRACIGYAIHSPPHLFDKSFDWMPSLIEHIYWNGRLATEPNEEDNDLIQDLQEYFGYAYDEVIPRIRECVNARSALDVKGDAPSGDEVLRFFATRYFDALAKEASIAPDTQPAWVENEVERFMHSPALPLFASCWMNLTPFFALDKESLELPPVSHYTSTFKSLVSACYVISSDADSAVWVAALVHRLRQIQLTVHSIDLEIEDYGYVDTAILEKGVDVFRWSAIASQLQNRFRHWMMDLEIPVNAPHHRWDWMHPSEPPTVPKSAAGVGLSAPPAVGHAPSCFCGTPCCSGCCKDTRAEPRRQRCLLPCCESLINSFARQVPSTNHTTDKGAQVKTVLLISADTGKPLELLPVPSDVPSKNRDISPPFKKRGAARREELPSDKDPCRHLHKENGLYRPPGACLMKPLQVLSRFDGSKVRDQGHRRDCGSSSSLSSSSDAAQLDITYDVPVEGDVDTAGLQGDTGGSTEREVFTSKYASLRSDGKKRALIDAEIGPLKSQKTNTFSGDAEATIRTTGTKKPIHVKLVREGRRGSPRVYVERQKKADPLIGVLRKYANAIRDNDSDDSEDDSDECSSDSSDSSENSTSTSSSYSEDSSSDDEDIKIVAKRKSRGIPKQTPARAVLSANTAGSKDRAAATAARTGRAGSNRFEKVRTALLKPPAMVPKAGGLKDDRPLFHHQKTSGLFGHLAGGGGGRTVTSTAAESRPPFTFRAA